MKLSRLLVPLFLFFTPLCEAATIKLFTDYPVSTPVGSDFLLFQRNGTYFCSAQSQFLPVWFNNPVFTGNGSINGAFNVGGTLTVGGAVITGVTYYGDGSGLSNVASQVYLKNLNDNGTNETFWSSTFNGISTFQEIDATSAYFTNLFTFLTNAQYTCTDGNGKLIAGTGLPATNVLLSAGANIVFTTNLDGSIVIAGSATNTSTVTTNNTFVNTNVFISTSNSFFNNTYITNLYTVSNTNNTFVNTNLFISTSNAYFTNNTFINTNFSTNLFFVSGKGNTVVITNVFVSEQGLLVNSNTAVSSAVITDAKHAYTNAVNAVGVFTNSASGPPSFGLIQSNVIAAGISPILNLQASTNLIYRYTTNAITALTLTFGQAFTTNLSADITISAINAQDLAAYETCILTLTNSSGSDFKVTLPNGIRGTPGSGTPPVFYCTNKLSCDVMIAHYGNQRTNAWKIDWAP